MERESALAELATYVNNILMDSLNGPFTLVVNVNDVSHGATKKNMTLPS